MFSLMTDANIPDIAMEPDKVVSKVGKRTEVYACVCAHPVSKVEEKNRGVCVCLCHKVVSKVEEKNRCVCVCLCIRAVV